MCLDDATALAVLERRVPPGVALEIDAHVDECSDCAHLLAALGKMAVGEARPTGETEPTGDDQDLHAGVKIGRFVIEQPIGRGGMGVVYAATDPELRRRVAIKVLRPSSNESTRATDRITREARVMARLVHPNVVTVYDVGRHAGRVYIVMELVEGTNLRSWLLRRPRTVGEILEVFVAAGRGLAAAHAEELVHRDFKPDNVLLQLDRATGRVVRVAIADFGLARDTLASVSITGPLNVLGTPAYMAPEQRRGAPTTAHVDQYSFCVALDEALSSSTPDSTPRTIPRRVREAIARGLEKEPRDRHRSMTDLIAILEAASRAGRSRIPPRVQRVGVAALGAVALVLGLVFAKAPTSSAAAIESANALEPPSVATPVRTASASASASTAPNVVKEAAAQAPATATTTPTEPSVVKVSAPRARMPAARSQQSNEDL